MKSVKDLRSQLNEMAEDDAEMRKLSALVRSGLFDAKKLTLLKRALHKDNMKMTKAERDTLLDLLDRLLNIITNNQQVFQKVKQSVNEQLMLEDYEFSMARSQLKTIIRDAEALLAQIQGEGEMESWMQSKITLASDYIGAVADNVVSGESEIKKLKEEYEEYTIEEAVKLGVDKDINTIPALLVLKRRSIRVFPDGQKVALYYSDRLNKFVTVPFTSIGLSEELNEAAVDWAWAQGYAKRHAAANDDTLSPQDRANAAKELADYHERTKTRFGDTAAKSLKSTYQQQLNKAQQARQAAADRAKAMGARGAADKQARRAKSQRELRGTMKSNALKDFGRAYRDTSGNLGGSIGIAIGSSIRRAALKTKTMSRDIKRSARPGAGPLKEAFERNRKLIEQALPAPQWEPPGTYQPPGWKPNQGPANTNLKTWKPSGSPANLNKPPNVSPAVWARMLARLGVVGGLAAGAWAAMTTPAGGKGDDTVSPEDVAATKKELLKTQPLTKPVKPVEIPKIPDYVEPAAQPAAQPLAKPVEKPEASAQPLARTQAYPNLKTNAKPATQTEPEPKGPRSRGGKRGKSATGGLPFIPIVPFDISAGKGKKGGIGAMTGIDPFQSNAQKLGGAGVYGGGAVQQKAAAQARAATRAMANMREKYEEDTNKDDDEEDDDSKKKSSSGSKSVFDITYPTSISGRRSINTLKGYNPFEKSSDSARAGVYSSPAVAMQQTRLQNQVNKAMSQRQESVIDKLKTMVNEDISSKELQIGEEYITINNGMAKKIVHVYESVNRINKVKMEKMLNENVDNFTKILQFATKN